MMTISLNYAHKNKALIYFAWFAGLLAGVLFTANTDSFADIVMRPVLFSRSSFCSFISILILPYYICVVAFWLSKPLWLVAIIFLRAFIFGFSYFIISFAYQDAGWIARILIMFADSISVVFWLWFLLRHPTVERSKLGIAVLQFSLVSIVVGVVDYYFVSPLTAIFFV